MKYEIEQFNPCNDALIFRKKYKTFRGAWNNCPRGDWMLWIAKRVGIDIRLLTLAKGYCAKTVIHLMTDQRSKDAVKAAIDYGHGKIDDVQLRNAVYAAANANANAADAAYAANAANANASDAASDAAYAAAVAAYSAAYAANAVYVAANAAAYAAYAAAYAADAAKKNQKATADICRKYLTKSVMEKIKSL